MAATSAAAVPVATPDVAGMAFSRKNKRFVSVFLNPSAFRYVISSLLSMAFLAATTPNPKAPNASPSPPMARKIERYVFSTFLYRSNRCFVVSTRHPKGANPFRSAAATSAVFVESRTWTRMTLDPAIVGNSFVKAFRSITTNP